MERHGRLDSLARDLASGEISRRSALKRLAGASLGLGAAIAPAGVADAIGAGCPGGRVNCDGRCCPKNARCRNGRCKCKPGFRKCGRKCVDTGTSIKHCGACNDPCPHGQSCVAGRCEPPECATDADCPGDPGNGCLRGVCSAGACRLDPVANNSPCDDRSACTSNESCQNGVCTGGSPVVCQPQDQCHDAGVCNPQTGQCTNPPKPDNTPCNDGSACTQNDRCQGGICTHGPICPPPHPECHHAYCEFGGCRTVPLPNGYPCGSTRECFEGVCRDVP